MTLPLILLAIGATFRTSHLVVYERGPWALAERLRSWVVNRYGGKSWQAEGIGCMLCVSFWAALLWVGVALLTTQGYTAALILLLWWGIAGAVLALQSWLIRR